MINPVKSFLIILLVGFIAGCSPKIYVYQSPWQSAPVAMNGTTNGFRTPLRFTDQDTHLDYSVTNDGNYLYICLQTYDEATTRGITQRGLQIWIDTTGGRNHQVGIVCPLPEKQNYANNNNNQNRRRYNSYNRQDTLSAFSRDTAEKNTQWRSFNARSVYMHVSGFKNIPNGERSLPDSSGINVIINWDVYNKELVCNTAIPLPSFFRYPLVPSDSNRDIGISFVFTSIPNAPNYGRGGGFSPGIGIGIGGFGFGGIGMGFAAPIGGGGGGGVAQPQAVTIWRPFYLTTVTPH